MCCMGPQARRIVLWTGIGLLSLLLHRAIFAALHYGGQPSADVAASLVAGIRFDLASLPIVVGPYLLLSAILELFEGKLPRLFSRSLLALQILWMADVHISLFASTFNYGVNEKHLGWEYFAYLNDLPGLYMATWEKDKVSAVFYTLMPFLCIGLAGYIFQRQGGFRTEEKVFVRFSFRFPRLFALAGLIVAAGVFARGGLQQSPLRSADAMVTSSPYLNNLRLNVIFTVMNDSGDTLDFKTFYSRDENIAFVNELLGSGKLSAEYPMLRYMPPRTLRADRGHAPTKPNVILVIVESFTAKFLETEGYDPSIAPEFNRLVRQGVYFKRFYATGGRSANGLFAMFSGVPDRAGRTILRSSQIQNRFGGLAGLLSRRGYRTMFVHGGDLKFDNLATVLPHLGFQKSFGRDEIERSGFKGTTNVLGYDDADVFRYLLTQTDGQGPFFAAVFTQNTHYPYISPEIRDYSKDRIANLFLSSYHYVDSLLGAFVKSLEQKPYARDTIVLFVADHTHHAGLNYLEDRTIPFLIYAPAVYAPRQVDLVSSQLDILPVILSLTGGDTLYSGMGRDSALDAGLVSGEAMDASREPFAYFAGGSNTNVIGWIQGDRIALSWLDRDTPLFLTARPPVSAANFALTEKEQFALFTKRMQHYHQYARTLEKSNRIWPEPSELEQIDREIRR